MRLRDLTPDELAAVDARRAAVREALAEAARPGLPDPAAVDAAPFLDEWEPVPYPGSDRPCLRGLVWGHPVHGDSPVTTSVLVARGPGWAVTESGRLYVLGERHVPRPPSSILAGRRGPGRPHPAPPPGPRSGTDDDDLPPIEPPRIP